LVEAANWQANSGMPMWRGEDLTSEQVSKDIHRYFVAFACGQPAGTLKFQTEDKYVWPDIEDNAAAYVHRLAVRRSFAGQGVSTLMLSWAVDRARALGKQFVRLDCDTERLRLRKIYEDFGFTHHSDKQWGSVLVTRYAYEINCKDTGQRIG
jgi:GNAT superfamily N-acetyltransferase